MNRTIFQIRIVIKPGNQNSRWVRCSEYNLTILRVNLFGILLKLGHGTLPHAHVVYYDYGLMFQRQLCITDG